MKSIPILYSTDMVHALLENRKTMTRRTKGLEWINENPADWELIDKDNFLFNSKKDNPDYFNAKCPYGQIGDVLWVREKHKIYLNYDNQVYIQFEGRESFDVYEKKQISLTTLEKIKARKLTANEWHSCPSLHMYKEFANLFLEITNIRCEQLQDITEQDAKNEGIIIVRKSYFYNYAWKNYNNTSKEKSNPHFVSPIHSFMSLWLKINGNASWEANPWVWVVEFKQIEKPTNFI